MRCNDWKARIVADQTTYCLDDVDGNDEILWGLIYCSKDLHFTTTTTIISIQIPTVIAAVAALLLHPIPPLNVEKRKILPMLMMMMNKSSLSCFFYVCVSLRCWFWCWCVQGGVLPCLSVWCLLLCLLVPPLAFRDLEISLKSNNPFFKSPFPLNFVYLLTIIKNLLLYY